MNTPLSKISQPDNLRGQLLIAMPGLLDPNFVHAVVYICEHSPEGAMGIAINRPLGLNLGEVFEQLALQYSPQTGAQALLCGGPVETQQGFVLHHPGKKQWQSTATITENICLTTSRDILDDMADEQGPDNTLVALGYAGWMGGQLEQELLDNAWLTVPAQAAFLSELLFQCALENRASLAAASIGVDLSQLSNSVGHA